MQNQSRMFLVLFPGTRYMYVGKYITGSFGVSLVIDSTHDAPGQVGRRRVC